MAGSKTRYGMAVHHEDGTVGYLVDARAQPALFDTKEETEKELRRRKKDKSYSWALPITIEPFVNRREKETNEDVFQQLRNEIQ